MEMKLMARRLLLLVSLLFTWVAAEGVAKHNEYPREVRGRLVVCVCKIREGFSQVV